MSSDYDADDDAGILGPPSDGIAEASTGDELDAGDAELLTALNADAGSPPPSVQLAADLDISLKRRRGRSGSDGDDGSPRPTKRARLRIEAGLDPVTGLPPPDDGSPQFQSLAAAMDATYRRGTVENTRKYCLLCSYGNRSFDATDRGFKLFDTFLQQMMSALVYGGPDEAIRVGERFYVQFIAPRFLDANVALPPFERDAIREHITTQRHTICNRFFVPQSIRILSDLRDLYLSEISTKANGADPVKGALVMRIIAQQRSMYRDDPVKWSYGAPQPSEPAPDVQALLTESHQVHAAVSDGHFPAHVERWLREANE
jgi:hypothetical protein